MPTCARREIVRQNEPGIYHCWSRCVRRAWLMGRDRYSGHDYSHRRGWVLDRLELLVRCFAIDVGFFSTMANHLHLVLRTNPRLADRWGDYEVARRWLRAYPGKRILDSSWREPTDVQVESLAQNKRRIRKLRKRLADVSWFMGNLSEHIARRANLEDQTSGRFWEGRYSCRELADEAALLVCGAYVDLNQIRAGEALTPSDSWNSSIGFRLQNRESRDGWLCPLTLAESDVGDMPNEKGKRASDKGLLTVSLSQYLEILEWTVKQQHGKPGDSSRPPAITRCLSELQIIPAQWTLAVRDFARRFRRISGRRAQMVRRAEEAGKKWFHGQAFASQVFQ